VVDPYGLVAKAGVWYLMSACKGSIRVARVSELLDARMLDESFERPEDFDLAASWQAWCAGWESSHSAYLVTVRVSPALLPHLPAHFGARIRDTVARAGPPDGEGWVTLDLSFASLEAARDRLLGFGGAVEVLKPLPLRCSIQDFARRIAALYVD
jgi:predicted DNA-binding transcriptional regulator YafY